MREFDAGLLDGKVDYELAGLIESAATLPEGCKRARGRLG
jgi:hypothetical protein